MADFEVRTNNLNNLGDKFDVISKKVRCISNEARGIMANTRYSITAKIAISLQRAVVCGNINNSAQDFTALSNGLRRVSNMYSATERKLSNGSEAMKEMSENYSRIVDTILAKLNEWKTKILEWVNSILNPQSNDYRIDSVVFDEDGSYGGDQGSPYYTTGDEREELYDIVRQYYPNMTPGELDNFFEKLNSEGCGYVAVVNTIFAAYEGREEEFERTFGFPMYNEDGDLNYNKLLVDYYCATDNHNKNASGQDFVNVNEDDSPTDGVGTSASDRKYRTELYLDSKGVDVKIQNNVNVSVDNFDEYSDGQVIVAFADGNLYNRDGSVAQYIDGGHAMVITGVTEDGRYIVSSWGDEYYLDPDDGTYRNFAYYEY